MTTQKYLRVPQPEPPRRVSLQGVSNYTHTRLDHSKAHVRLLALDDPDSWPSLNTSDRTVPTGRLETFELENCPPYIALSHEWGVDEPSHPAIIDGFSLGLRQNLHRFLVRLAEHDRRYWYRTCKSWSEGYWARYYWIDQICIDQSHLPERNHQVRMMTRIFTNATEVVAWLGDEAPEGGRDFRPTAWVTSSAREHAEQLFKPSFWTRLWCQQEIALARTLTFMTHMECLPTRAAGQADVGYWRDSPSTNVPQCLRLFESIKDVGTSPDLKLEDAIKMFSRKQCVDVKDKIYGIQGMVRPSERLLVDYHLPARQVMYAALDKVLEFENQQQHPTPDCCEMTFSLLALDMGLKDEEENIKEYIAKHHRVERKPMIASIPTVSSITSTLSDHRCSEQLVSIPVKIPLLKDIRRHDSARSGMNDIFQHTWRVIRNQMVNLWMALLAMLSRQRPPRLSS